MHPPGVCALSAGSGRRAGVVRPWLLLPILCLGCGPPEPPRRIDPGLTPGELVLPVGPAPEEPALPDGVRLRVMTFNLYGGRFASAEAIGAFLAGQELDLVGLQECPADYLAPIAARTGLAHHGGEGVALLSRTPLADLRLVQLRTGRSFVHATTQLEGVTFSVYVAHLGWNLDGDRQCRELVDDHLAADPVQHLVVMGDFNDEHLSSQIAILEERLADAATSMGWYPGQRISWPSTRFDDTEGSQLIDLVFFRRDLQPLVLGLEVHNLQPVLSDHKPVGAELLYPRDERPFAVDPFAALRDPRRGWPDPPPPDLLVNPGAEDGLAGWLAEGGAVAAAGRENQLPRAGLGLFTGFSERPAEGVRWSAGSQEVELAAWAGAIDARRCRLLAAGQAATGYRTESDGPHTSNLVKPYDEGELVLEALDAQGGRVLGRASSGRRDTLGWHPLAFALPLPPGARSARLTWMSHHKAFNGGSNDAVFDELYLGLDCQGAPHGLLGPDLLRDPGAEDGGLSAWSAAGWQRLTDLTPVGLAIFPPLSRSGRGLLFAGGPLDLEPGPAGLSSLGQVMELEDLLGVVDGDGLALRWGGWLRTWTARTRVAIGLEIFDGDGSLWGRVEGGGVHAAEWSRVEHRTRIPAGASAVRLVLEADVEALGTGVFADDLFVQPEALE